VIGADVVAEVDRIAAFELGRHDVGGVSVALIAEASVAFKRTYGWADANRRADESTVYRAASVTKPFTGLMLLQLAERGALRLSDPLTRYVPEFAAVPAANDRAAVSLVQLATMTAGIPSEVAVEGEARSAPPMHFERAVLAAIPAIVPIAEPGTRFLYSNLSYGLLGLACARAAGRPYDEYLRDEILRPLDMHASGFGPTVAPIPTLAKGYDLTEGEADTEAAEREHRGRGYALPAGGLYTTLDDLCRFVSFCVGTEAPAVLASATWSEARDALVAADRDLNFGEGVGFAAIRDLAGSVAAPGHFGIVSGYKCGVVYSPQDRVGVAVCANITRTADTTDLARSMLALLPRLAA